MATVADADGRLNARKTLQQRSQKSSSDANQLPLVFPTGLGRSGRFSAVSEMMTSGCTPRWTNRAASSSPSTQLPASYVPFLISAVGPSLTGGLQMQISVEKTVHYATDVDDESPVRLSEEERQIRTAGSISKH